MIESDVRDAFIDAAVSSLYPIAPSLPLRRDLRWLRTCARSDDGAGTEQNAFRAAFLIGRVGEILNLSLFFSFSDLLVSSDKYLAVPNGESIDIPLVEF